jgi:hypothetical protein
MQGPFLGGDASDQGQQTRAWPSESTVPNTASQPGSLTPGRCDEHRCHGALHHLVETSAAMEKVSIAGS